MKGIIRIKATYLLACIILSGFAILLVPSCTHETMGPAEPDPVDTTGNPIDTTGNPIDTSFSGTPCDPNLVYFSRDIMPLLASNCAKSGCHDAISHQDGVVLDSYQNIMESDVIDPYDLDDSDLYEAITENDDDKQMPPPPAQRLTTAQISMIAKWIQQGAKDLTCDENAGQCVTTNVSYSGFVAPVLLTYCVGCHSGGSPSGNISLTTHASVQTLALSGRLHGVISWAAGFPRMPQGSARLPQCTIDKIKGWIDDGALNN